MYRKKKGMNKIQEPLLPLIFTGHSIQVLDQRLLPGEEVFHERKDLEGVYESIHSMELRGAPLIGIAAAYGMFLGVAGKSFQSVSSLLQTVKQNASRLASSRPTAKNLFWAIDRILHLVEKNLDKTPEQIIEHIRIEAVKINEEDVLICKNIGENFLTILKKGMTLLTHCNAGALATYRYGTATAPMYLGQERGWNFKVFVDETRPYNQGARLTAFELHRAGIDVTLICDNMAAMVMSKGWVDAIVVGSDRVAANGDVANKIGTLNLSILAKYYGIPFYIATPTPTLDVALPDGNSIPIEERSAEEITHFRGKRVTPEGIRVFNPSFDVSPHQNITAIVTEKGIATPPFTDSLRTLCAKR